MCFHFGISIHKSEKWYGSQLQWGLKWKVKLNGGTPRFVTHYHAQNVICLSIGSVLICSEFICIPRFFCIIGCFAISCKNCAWFLKCIKWSWYLVCTRRVSNFPKKFYGLFYHAMRGKYLASSDAIFFFKSILRINTELLQ